MRKSSMRLSLKKEKRKFTKKPMTLLEFIIHQQKRYFQSSGEFSQLINGMQTAIKIISFTVRKAIIDKVSGNGSNKLGADDDHRELDQIAEEILISLLSSSRSTSILVSNISSTPYYVDPDLQGKHVVCFDPLCGYSNLESLAPLGTIFGIFRQKDRIPNQHDFIRPANQMIAAGYAMYGNLTLLVLSLGTNEGVFEFTLDPEVGEFILTDSSLRMPSRGKVYSINEGFSNLWDPAVAEYVRRKKDPRLGRPYEFRYVGSFVADVHRTLKIGGIYMAPGNSMEPYGKLHLMFECNPVAFIIREAGGLASSGFMPTLDLLPEHPKQPCPLFLGSIEDVTDLLELITLLKATQITDNPLSWEENYLHLQYMQPEQQQQQQQQQQQ